MFAAIAFAVAGLLPSMYFLWAGFSDDPTATGSVGSAVARLVGIVVVIGAVLGTIGWPRRTICWAARRCHRGRARVMEVRGGVVQTAV